MDITKEELKRIINDAEQQIKFEESQGEKVTPLEKTKFIDFLVLEQLEKKKKANNLGISEDEVVLTDSEEHGLWYAVDYKTKLLKLKQAEVKNNLKTLENKKAFPCYFLYMAGIYPQKKIKYSTETLSCFTVMPKNSLIVPNKSIYKSGSRDIFSVLMYDVECLRKFGLVDSERFSMSSKIYGKNEGEVVSEVRHLNGLVYAFCYFDVWVYRWMHTLPGQALDKEIAPAIFGVCFDEADFNDVDLNDFFSGLKEEIKKLYLGKQTIADLVKKYPVIIQNRGRGHGRSNEKSCESFERVGFLGDRAGTGVKYLKTKNGSMLSSGEMILTKK